MYALGFDPQAEAGDPKVVALNDLMLTLQDASFAGNPTEPFVSERWQVVVNGDFIPGETGLPEDVRPYPPAVPSQREADHVVGERTAERRAQDAAVISIGGR